MALKYADKPLIFRKANAAMLQRKSDPKNKHLDSVINLAKQHSQNPALATFIRDYYDDIAAEDLLQHSVEDLCGAALGHWEFGAKRAAHESRVRVFNPDAKKNSWKSPH
ncbi:MAG: hypothetical protein ACRESC_05135, partial [Gammaproteobacteria bacterium]